MTFASGFSAGETIVAYRGTDEDDGPLWTAIGFGLGIASRDAAGQAVVKGLAEVVAGLHSHALIRNGGNLR